MNRLRTSFLVPLGFALALLGAPACSSPPKAEQAVRIDPSFEPAFAALRGALAAGDDELAERILARILARQPKEDALKLARVYESVVEGRKLVGHLELRLECVAGPGAGDVNVALLAGHDLEQALVLRGGAGMLRLLLVGVDPTGTEQRNGRTMSVESVTEIHMSPGVPARVELGRFALPTGASMAVRVHWSLDLSPGEIQLEGASHPATGLVVAPCEMVRLASYLPSAAVEPEELVRYLRGERFSTPAMLERTVRIDLERRAEALDLLTPYVIETNPVDVARAIPALRWLSGQRQFGADVGGWRLWLQARASQREAGLALELPSGSGAAQGERRGTSLETAK